MSLLSCFPVVSLSCSRNRESERQEIYIYIEIWDFKSFVELSIMNHVQTSKFTYDQNYTEWIYNSHKGQLSFNFRKQESACVFILFYLVFLDVFVHEYPRTLTSAPEHQEGLRQFHHCAVWVPETKPRLSGRGQVPWQLSCLTANKQPARQVM